MTCASAASSSIGVKTTSTKPLSAPILFAPVLRFKQKLPKLNF